MTKLGVFLFFACFLVACAVVGFMYTNERSRIIFLQDAQTKLLNQEQELGEFPEQCQDEIEQSLLGKEFTINCSVKAYCLCTKLNTPFFEANSSSELCAESKLDPTQRYYCVSNKPGGQL